jgi:integrase
VHTPATVSEKPKRKQGEGGITWPSKNSRCWQISFPIDGRQHRESSGTADYDEAVKVLAKRIAEHAAGQKILKSQKTVRYEDLRALLVEDYRNGDKGIRTKKNGVDYFAGQPSLDKFFRDMAVFRIDADKLKEYLAECREAGLSDPTVRRHFNSLKKMFSLGVHQEKITNRPPFPKLRDSKACGQYVTPQNFQKIMDAMPEESRPFFKFMYFCGCREGATLDIRWEMVSADCNEIEFPAEMLKQDRPLNVPLVGAGGLGSLAELLKTIDRKPGKKVFHVTNFREIWEKAVTASGVGGVNPETKRVEPRIHDTRVSAAMNLTAAGVPAVTIMQIGGWKTMAMFLRYNIYNKEQAKKALIDGAEYVAKQIAAA